MIRDEVLIAWLCIWDVQRSHRSSEQFTWQLSIYDEIVRRGWISPMPIPDENDDYLTPIGQDIIDLHGAEWGLNPLAQCET